MESCLEYYSENGTQFTESGRNFQLTKNHYTRNDQYSTEHPDALANDNEGRKRSYNGIVYTMGRGTGVEPHEDWQPNCRATLGQYIAGFDVTGDAGNALDKNARKNCIVRSKYGPDNQYNQGDNTITLEGEGQLMINLG